MMRRLFQVILVLGGALLSGCGSGGDEPPPPPSAADRVSVTPLFSENAAVPGQRFLVLWRFDLADGWHLYWNGRNDSGFPPAVKLDLPPGWQAGPLLWPAPERYLTPGEILDHVYHGQLLLLQELMVPETAQMGRKVTIPARLDWLICREECVPGHAEVKLEIPVADQAHPSEEADLVAQAVDDLPLPAPAGGIELLWSESSVEMVVPGAAGLEFYPARDCGLLVDLIKDGVGENGRLVLRLRAKDGRIGPVKGILHQQLIDGSKRNWLLEAHPGG